MADLGDIGEWGTHFDASQLISGQAPEVRYKNPPPGTDYGFDITGNYLPTETLAQCYGPMPTWRVAQLSSVTEPSIQLPAHRTVRPQGTFTTQVDGVNDARPVVALVNNSQAMYLASDQPTEFNQLPAGAVEFLVFGEGVKRSEVWGPYTLTVETFALTGTMPDGQVSVPYSSALTAATAGGTVVWYITGELPPGLSHSAGTVSGTPTLAGTYKFTIGARDPWNQARLYKDFTVTIAP